MKKQRTIINDLSPSATTLNDSELGRTVGGLSRGFSRASRSFGGMSLGMVCGGDTPHEKSTSTLNGQGMPDSMTDCGSSAD